MQVLDLKLSEPGLPLMCCAKQDIKRNELVLVPWLPELLSPSNTRLRITDKRSCAEVPDSVEVQLELKGSGTKSFWWNSPAGKFLEGDKK